MTHLFIVTAEHPYGPGTHVYACESIAGANREAARFVNIIRDDSKREMDGDTLPPEATPENWESVLQVLADWHGEATCRTDITELDTLP